MQNCDGKNHTSITMNYLVATLIALTVVQVNCEGPVYVVRTNPGLKTPRTLSAEERALLEKPPQIDFKPTGTTPQELSKSTKNSVVNSQIVGGILTVRGAIPYQCLVEQDNAYICGGSLISYQWVLTAAHCALGRTNFQITLGAQDRAVFEAGRIKFDTTIKIVHEAYKSTTLANDIALVKLPLLLTPPNTAVIYWAVVRLPRKSQATLTFAGLLGLASGWGKTADNATSATKMSNVQMTIITNIACAPYYTAGIILPSNICTNTTGGTKSTCQGDSGGPLVIKETDNIYTLVGVTSFVSSLGCQSGAPAGFVRVTAYLGWISNKTGIAILP